MENNTAVLKKYIDNLKNDPDTLYFHGTEYNATLTVIDTMITRLQLYKDKIEKIQKLYSSVKEASTDPKVMDRLKKVSEFDQKLLMNRIQMSNNIIELLNELREKIRFAKVVDLYK